MQFLKNKKAIELSLSFIIILIMSLVILGFGIRLMSQLFSKATDITNIPAEDFDRQIANLMCEGSERLCVIPQRKTIIKGDYSVVGVRIINILEPPAGQPATLFRVEIKTPDGPPTGLLGYGKNNLPIIKNDPVGFDGLVVSPTDTSGNPLREAAIKKYEERNVAFAVQVPTNAPSGTYILNVKVTANGADYPPVHKVYIEVP